MCHTVHSCSAWDWIECAGLVAACAVACIDPLDGICEVCLGVSYDQCVSCIGLTSDINALVTLQGDPHSA